MDQSIISGGSVLNNSVGKDKSGLTKIVVGITQAIIADTDTTFLSIAMHKYGHNF